MDLEFKEKRKRLLLLAAAALVGIGLIAFFMILPLRAKIKAKGIEITQLQTKLANAQRSGQLADEFAEELRATTEKLDTVEQSVAQGDIYRWMVNVLDSFGKPFNLDLGRIEQPLAGDLTIPPKVPYKGATFTVNGTATYYDFGRFLAEFERRYPLIRLQTLELEPASYVEADPTAPGRLTFRMVMVVLVKEAAAAP
jgi:hypothetical protein